MNQIKQQPLWLFILLPAITMLLAWGLRGYIGGGPFGAMIPGAMVTLTICMLLDLPPMFTAVVVVFGVAGIGIGGEMTYGQTLGFLRNPDTVWWGILATTVKGGVWGLMGGAVLGLGLVHKRISKKTIIIAFALTLIGLLIGFKIINDPKLIYFSDPVNKPRDESWGAILFGALALLSYLKFTIKSEDSKIILRFALWGLIGGGLGFGLGGLWMVLGSSLPNDVIVKSWWKLMEFSFGFLFGGALGYVAWLNRNEFSAEKKVKTKEATDSKKTLYKELITAAITGLAIYAILPALLEPIVDGANSNDGMFISALRDFSRMFVNYAFFGFILVIIALYKPAFAWQMGITLTFCHAAIDLAGDLGPETGIEVHKAIQVIFILLTTLIVALLTAKYHKRKNVLLNMFLIVTWSLMVIAYMKTGTHLDRMFTPGQSFCQLICGSMLVYIIFTISAIWITIKAKKLIISN
jgi:hypothetical protein